MVCICTFLAHLIGILKALSFLHFAKRSNVASCSWIQKYDPQSDTLKKKISDFQHSQEIAGLKQDQSLFGSHLQMNQKMCKASHYPYLKKGAFL